MSDRRSWTRVGEIGLSLSLVVSLEDLFTGGRADGDPRVRVDGEGPDTETPGGYHVFLDRGVDAVTVAVDGGDLYLDEERTVDLLTHDPADPVTFELHPAPAYAFPTGANLIRGSVENGAGDPVAGATVSVDGISRSTRTDARGEYVYFLELGTDGSAVERGGRTVFEVGGSDPTVRADHPDHTAVPTTVTVEEGSTAVADLQFP